MSALPSIRLGISSCLLGEEVRYDGGHKRDPFLVQTLGPMVEWVPVCPEVEVGLGTPREAIRLVRDPKDLAEVRLMTGKTGVDLTKQMRSYARTRVRALAREGLSGYILKKDSPSCGMARVKVWRDQGMPERNGRGLFAAELLRQYPNMPVEEEGRLHDPRLRENFIDRVFMYRRLRALLSSRWTIGDLVRFHTAHKLVLMAHSPQGYREIGRLVGEAKGVPRAELMRRYEDELMAAMAKPATRARHTSAPHEHAATRGRPLQADARPGVAPGIGVGHRRLPPRARPAHRAADTDSPSRPSPQRVVPPRPALSRPGIERTDVAQSCVTSPGWAVRPTTPHTRGACAPCHAAC